MAKAPRALCLDAFLKLHRAADTLLSRVTEELTAAGLTYAQFSVLEALQHQDGLCQRDIATKVFRSPGNVTVVVNNLERRGLVRRERGNGREKLVTVRLTANGTKLITRVFPKVGTTIERAFRNLRGTEIAELSRLLRLLGHTAAER